MNGRRILELLAEEGVVGSALERAAALLKSTRATGTERCMGCGSKALLRDYVCGACSAQKAEHQARFWSWANDLQEGGPGRPRALKGKPQELPPQVERPKFQYLREIREIAELPQERFNFLVHVGCIGRVVVARFGFEAIRMVKEIHGLHESATHAVERLDITTDDFTDVKAEKKAWEVP